MSSFTWRRMPMSASALQHPRKDLEQNTIATFNVLEAMRAQGIKRIAFSSTGSVYGEAEKIPTPEDAPFPVQTSLYGVSKLSGEGLIAAYGEGFGFEGYIFRFVSILGERYTHGHVFDFYKQLAEHPERLDVLGDGSQRKSYLHIGDCVEAILHVVRAGTARGAKHGVQIYNLGTAEYCQVKDSIGWICARTWRAARIAFYRRRTGLDRRQSIHFSRHRQNSRHRLEAGIDHPRRRRAHRPMAARQRMGICASGVIRAHEDHGPWPLASRLRHRGLLLPALSGRPAWILMKALTTGLSAGKAPLFEPGLDDLIAANIAAGRLRFSTDPAEAVREAEVLWVTYDTPVNDADESDSAYVLERLRHALEHLPAGVLVLISSQLPVGTCAELERSFPQFHFACSPENLRLGQALGAFEKAERAVVGIRSDTKRPLLESLFAPFTSRVIFMRTESAEMVKHALNSFLAVSITFINEVARLCEHVGADAAEVSLGLKSEPRIGPRAYLGAGGPFAGGTLARDVVTLRTLGQEFDRTARGHPGHQREQRFASRLGLPPAPGAFR